MSFDGGRRDRGGDREAGAAKGVPSKSVPGKSTLSGAITMQQKPATGTRVPGAPSSTSATNGAHHDPFGFHLVSTSQAGAALAQERDSHPGSATSGQVRFRVPTGADIKSMMVAGDIPEPKLKESIQTALTRMQKDGKLKSKDAVSDIMRKIFPAPGKFDEVEFANAIDVSDRSNIYKSVADAQSKVSSTDKPKLSAVMDDAIKLVDGAIADAAGLKEVFGGQDAAAKAVYMAAKTKIVNMKVSMDTMLHTDYNRDDEEVGLGGWANNSSQMVHLQRKVAEVADAKGAAITIIHEASHLADPSVDDQGYYGSPGFEALPEAVKVGNAAHFEELPRRAQGTSKYPGLTFKPGVTKTGTAMTFEDEVRREASEYLRKAWDKSVDVHMFLRGIRQDIEGGSDASFKANDKRIIELSKLMHLTIHEQKPPKTINMNDIILAEGVARATIAIKKSAPGQAVPPAPAVGKTKKDYVEQVIDGSIKSYGALTGNAATDRTLMDWMSAEFQKPL